MEEMLRSLSMTTNTEIAPYLAMTGSLRQTPLQKFVITDNVNIFVKDLKQTLKKQRMILQIEKQKSCMVVKINSEKLDSMIAPELKAELVNINADGAKNIIIDMSGARYCDSSGLSAILVGNRLCKNSGGMLVLTGLKESVKKLILISQLDSILNTAVTLEEGITLIGEAKTSI